MRMAASRGERFLAAFTAKDRAIAMSAADEYTMFSQTSCCSRLK